MTNPKHKKSVDFVAMFIAKEYGFQCDNDDESLDSNNHEKTIGYGPDGMRIRNQINIDIDYDSQAEFKEDGDDSNDDDYMP